MLQHMFYTQIQSVKGLVDVELQVAGLSMLSL